MDIVQHTGERHKAVGSISALQHFSERQGQQQQLVGRPRDEYIATGRPYDGWVR